MRINENRKVTLTLEQLKRLIRETIERDNGHGMVNENDHKWNPAIEKIVSGFQPKVHDIEGVSLTEFGTEDPVKLAEKIYPALAQKNGLTGTRRIPGGWSHAGHDDYPKSLDGDFKLYFNDRPTFTFRHLVLNKRSTKWVPDGNPYDGVSPVTVWTTMADHCAVTVKPGFKMADLKDVQKGMKAVSYFSEEFHVGDAKYPFNTLKWLFQANTSLYDVRMFNNYLNFVAYEAGPFLTKKLLDLGTISGTDLAELTAQIVNLNGVEAALEPGRGEHGQTPEEFKSSRDNHRWALKQKLADKKNAAAAQATVAEFKKLIDGGITYEELMNRSDFPNIVTAVLTSSEELQRRGFKPSCCDYHEYGFGAEEDDLELYRDQYFDNDSYRNAFNETMDEEIEEFMTNDVEATVEYDSFEDGVLSALKYANDWNNVNPYDYVEEYNY